MGTAFTLSHIRKERAYVPRIAVPTNEGGWLSRYIARRMRGRGLGDLDVETLKKLLQEAEHVMASTSLLLRNTAWPVASPPCCARTTMRPKRHVKKSRAA
jgi:hypothetical protein